MYKKIIKIIIDPKNNLPKIVPYLNSKFEPLKRHLFEFLKTDKYSKPYPGHSRLLKYINKTDGFFIEVGGNDGYFQDPTYYLEKFMKWRGIIVEPLSISILCKKNRRRSLVIKKACVSKDFKEKTATFIDCNAMSFIKDSIDNGEEWIKLGEESQKIKHREIVVPTSTIQEIIDLYSENKKIDFFVVDVEGYELEVLKGIDFKKNLPTYILTEAQNKKRLQEINDFLIQSDYYFLENIAEKDFLFKYNGK